MAVKYSIFQNSHQILNLHNFTTSVSRIGYYSDYSQCPITQSDLTTLGLIGAKYSSYGNTPITISGNYNKL